MIVNYVFVKFIVIVLILFDDLESSVKISELII